jgi:hypothetical protein
MLGTLEKRKHPRIRVSLPATYRSSYITADALITNISQSGVYISCPRVDTVGTDAELRINLPGRGELRLKGKVVWTGTSPDQGMGFLISELPREERLILANFLIARLFS